MSLGNTPLSRASADWVDVSMHHSTAGMDSRISASSHDKAHRFGCAKDKGQRAGELVLDGPLAGLHRPPGERRPVIPEVQPNAQGRREPATPQGGDGLVVVHSGRLVSWPSVRRSGSQALVLD